MIYDVNSPLFRSFLSQKGGASDKRKTEEQRPKEQRPKASDNKPVMNEVSLPLNFSVASSSAATTEQKILILKSSDGDEFVIKESIAVQSVTIKNMVEDDYSIIPLLNVNTRTLTKIIKYMKKHADAKMNLSEEDTKNFEKMDLNEKVIKNLEDIKNFDKEFVNTNSKNLFEVVFAANYLNIKGLFEFLCQTIADRIKNKSVKAVEIFNVSNDFTEEEEAKVYEEISGLMKENVTNLLISLCL